MTIYKDRHLSDQDLLLACDGELPARRQHETERHLKACWSCRKRMAELQHTISDFVDCYQSLDQRLPSGGEPESSMRRRLLKQRSSLARPTTLPGLRWGPLAVSACLLACLTGGFLVERWPRQAEGAAIPNPTLTPGEAIAAAKSDVCQASTQPANREVPEKLKEAVFSEYHLRGVPRNAYEVDFLITPELGGSTSLRNLWPQPYFSRNWNAHTKDALEERLHQLVCSGDLDLTTAQHEIATNWVAAYKKYVERDNPL